MNNFFEDEIEELVEEITGDKFIVFCGIDGCNEAILDAVREQVKDDVYHLYQGEEKKGRDEIIHMEQDKLMDMFLAKKHAYETGFNNVTNNEKDRQTPTQQLDLSSSDSVVEELKKSLKAAQPPPVVTSLPSTTATHPPTQLPLPQQQKITPELIASIEPVMTKQEDIQYNMTVTMYKSNIDVWTRIKGLDLRGKDFPISHDGSCPKCGFKSNIFVILDSLFPAGELPEILQNLLTQGKAILWSSKQNMKCKEPPTFLCSGNCPFTDIKKCGFNIDWKVTDLERIFSGRKLEANIGAPEDVEEIEEDDYYDSEESDNGEDEAEEYGEIDEEEYEEGLVDIAHYRGVVSWVVLDEFTERKDEIPENDQQSMIRTMLALEIARDDFVNGKMKMVEDNSEDMTNPNQEGEEKEEETKENEDIIIIDSSSEGKSPAADVEIYDLDQYGKALEEPENSLAEKITHNSFPVSKYGACPYCLSTNVVYILLKETMEDDPELPELLARLKREGKAECRIKGQHEWPSFQCRSCTYGFNLDWTSTSLEKIFYPKKSTYYQKQQTNTYSTPYSSSTNHNALHVNTSAHSVGSIFAPQVNAPPKTTQVNQLAINAFATPTIQPTMVPARAAAPRLIMPTVAGATPRLVQAMQLPQLVQQSVGTIPQINHPSTDMPQIIPSSVSSFNALPQVQPFSRSMPQIVPSSVSYMPPFQPFPGMFPMQPIPPPIGMPPQLASTLMNAINTVQSQQQLPFVQNPVAAPTLQWNGSNVWLAPPPPPQTQPSTSSASINIQIMHNATNSHQLSNSMKKTGGENKQSGASSSTYTKEIETIDMTSSKDIETVDLTTSKKDIETIDMTSSEDIEAVDMLKGTENVDTESLKNVATIDMTSSMDIETVDMESSTDIETIDMVTDSEIDDNVEMVPVDHVKEIETVDIVSDNEFKKDEKIPSKVKETIGMKADKEINKADVFLVNQIEAADMVINKTTQSVTSCPVNDVEKESAANKTPSSIESDKKSTESSLKPNIVRISLPFADDSGEENVSPFKKPVRQTPTADPVPMVKDNLSLADVESVSQMSDVTSEDRNLESRKRSISNSPLNSPMKHPRFDKHPTNTPKAPTKSPERRSVCSPFVGRLELLGDEPDLMNDDSMGIDNNALNAKLLLGGEETPAGANSPFTDTLFNIVGDVPSLDTEPISDSKRSRLNDKPKQEKRLDVSNFF